MKIETLLAFNIESQILRFSHFFVYFHPWPKHSQSLLYYLNWRTVGNYFKFISLFGIRNIGKLHQVIINRDPAKNN